MQAEAIYKGATRPAMKLGIPLVPLVILFGTGMLLIMWGGILVSWWLALGVVLSIAPVLLWMRWLTAFANVDCACEISSRRLLGAPMISALPQVNIQAMGLRSEA